MVYRFIDQYKTILELHHISFDTLSGQEQCGRSRLRIARSAPPPRSSPPAAAGASPPSFSAKMALAAFKKSTWVVCSSRCGVPHFSPPSNLWLHCQMVLRSGSYLVLCEPFPQKKGLIKPNHDLINPRNYAILGHFTKIFQPLLASLMATTKAHKIMLSARFMSSKRQVQNKPDHTCVLIYNSCSKKSSHQTPFLALCVTLRLKLTFLFFLSSTSTNSLLPPQTPALFPGNDRVHTPHRQRDD